MCVVMPRARLLRQTTVETMNVRCKRPDTVRSVGGTFSVPLMFFGVLLSVTAHLGLAIGELFNRIVVSDPYDSLSMFPAVVTNA